MRIGLIGDVHAEDNYLALAIESLTALNPSYILCTGDISDGPGSVNKCIKLLSDSNITTILGNHDRWMLDNIMRSAPDATRRDTLSTQALGYVRALPSTFDIDTPEGRLLLCHGLGENDMAKLNEDDFDYPYTLENHPEFQEILRRRQYRFVVSGHTHRWMNREYGGISFINAGTLKKEHNPGFALLETTTQELLWFNIRPK